MAENSKIEWTDATWNPIRAMLPAAGVWGYHCERISPGCQNCYAERMNGRMLPAWGTGLDYTVPNRDKAEVFLDEKELRKPLSWRKPRRVFVESMSDLFGAWVPDEMIDRVFAEMGGARRHTFQVLTKRADRLLRYMQRFKPDGNGWVTPGGVDGPECHCPLDANRWPLPNVWLGVSVEDQQRADERIPLLLQTPAAVRFLSVEPLLGPVDLPRWLKGQCPQCHGFDDYCADVALCETCGGLNRIGIDWVIVGGESGPGARPCNVRWVRSIVRQCRDAGVPCFVKQLGAYPVVEPCSQHHWDFGGSIKRKARFSAVDKMHPATDLWRVHFDDRKGGDPDEWPEDLRVRELPEVRAHA